MGEVEIYFQSFFTSELDGGIWSVTGLSRFTHAKALPVSTELNVTWPQNWYGLSE